jgi:shikimate kinase
VLPTVVLVGMMGSGKTTVGRGLADRLSRPFVDTDLEVERRTGSTVAEMWAAGQVDRFRQLESEALADALAGGPAVVAAAGGVVLRDDSRRLLADHRPVVWLRAGLPTLLRRVGDGQGRPLLAGDVGGTLARLDAERRPLYRSVADVVVDVDRAEAEEVVDAIVARLAAAGGPGESPAGGPA